MFASLNIWQFGQFGIKKKVLKALKMSLYNYADTLYTLMMDVGLLTVEWKGKKDIKSSGDAKFGIHEQLRNTTH